MKRKIQLFIFFCLHCSYSFSQEGVLKFSFAIEGSQSKYITTASAGIKAEAFITKKKNISLNYRFLLGLNSNKLLYIKSTLGGATGTGIIINTDGKLVFMNAAAILLCFIPEGVTYYPFKNRKGLPSIHFNPISFDYFKKT